MKKTYYTRSYTKKMREAKCGSEVGSICATSRLDNVITRSNLVLVFDTETTGLIDKSTTNIKC